MALRKPVKIGLIALVVGGAAFGINYYRTHGDAKMQSVDLKKSGGDLTSFTDTQSTPGQAGALNIASTAPAAPNGPRVKTLVIAWNALMGYHYAVGGNATKKGSLAEKYGLNLVTERQDDYGEMVKALASCATELKNGAKQCTQGSSANFVVIMGDAGPAFFNDANAALAKVGPQYKAEGIFSAGRSAGEDACMLPPEMKANPQLARGVVIAAVPRDGDQHICDHWIKLNGLCSNPDPTTHDANCVNWENTSTFTDADEKYIQGYCSDRVSVVAGKKTGNRVHVCVKGVATWTPGDVAVATKKGGLVKVLSTKENDSQMAALVIGIKAWNAANHDTVLNYVRAALEGGDQVKRGGIPALKRAAEASTEVYKEETWQYWMKYYQGVNEIDAAGLTVPLGGSRTWNLADNIRYFGLDGKYNYYADAYRIFGSYDKEMYPGDLSSFPAVAEVVNTSYLQELAQTGESKGTADTNTFDPGAAGDTVAAQDWHINFETGSASFSNDAAAPLSTLLGQLAVSGNTVVEVHGFTDNTGTPSNNMTLSENRANAVKQYLLTKSGGTFPANRIKVVPHGQNDPVCTTDNSAACRAANRRVKIVLKSNG